MARDEFDDDEALRWAGDEVTGREGPRLPTRRASDAAEASADEDVPAAPPRRPATTLLTGLFGVLYLAVTVGWILGTQYTAAGSIELLPQLLWQFGEFTAIIAAPLWFGTTLLLTRTRLGVRVGALLLGLGVLLPWPVLPLVVIS